MKTSILLAAVILGACLLAGIWRLRPAIPGLARSEAGERLASRWMLWFGLLLGVTLLSTAVTLLAGGPPGESTLGYLFRLLTRSSGNDSWMPMLQASTMLREHPELPIYQTLFFGQHVKFQYPLTALLLLDLPRALAPVDTQSLIAVYKVISRLCVLGIGVVFFKLFMHAAQETQEVHGRQALPVPRSSSIVLMLLCVLGVGLFYPITRSEFFGQIQTAITLVAALALLAWQQGKPRTAGVLIALCCLIKPQWSIFIVWALLRRQWQFALAATLTGFVGLLVAIAFYGFANVVDYVSVLSYLGRHGESYVANQSLNGLMHRLLSNGPNLDDNGAVWAGSDIPPFHPWVYAVTLASSIAIIGMALFWNRSKRPSALDMGLVMLSLTIASPIAWDHHYGILLPILALIVPAAVRYRPWGRWTIPYLALALLLTSQSFETPANFLAHSAWNFVQSYLFFGALMFLVLLYRLSWLERRTGAMGTVGAVNEEKYARSA
jgi:alpha-1,2-mannosyltransferase